MPLLSAQGITKRYGDGPREVTVLSNLDLQLETGELIGIFGASGTGKSTLLHLLGGLDTPTAGTISVEGNDLASMSEDERAHFRNRSIGFVFQFYHLLPEFTALENAMLPCLIAKMARKEARERAETSLRSVGLADRMHHRPSQLSGGEQQRVAIVRAAIMKPQVILADEPTGNLDHENGELAWKYLLALHQEVGAALVVVTHNMNLLASLPKRFELRDGRLQGSHA